MKQFFPAMHAKVVIQIASGREILSFQCYFNSHDVNITTQNVHRIFLSPHILSLHTKFQLTHFLLVAGREIHSWLGHIIRFSPSQFSY